MPRQRHDQPRRTRQGRTQDPVERPPIAESEARLRMVLTVARMGTWDWDIASNRVTYSDDLGPIFGLPRGSAHPTLAAFLDAVHPDDRERVAEAVTLALDTGADYGMEFRAVWPDRTVHTVANKGQVYRDATGRPIRMIGVALDITARQRAEDVAREAATLHAIAALAKEAAHAIGNPLMIISGHLSILAQGLAPESRDSQRIAEVITAVRRIRDIVTQLTQIVWLEHVASDSRVPPNARPPAVARQGG
jgi:PAS domain S-box-containing protein